MSAALATTMSPRGVALMRTLRATFAAMQEHAKTHPHEVAELYAVVGGQVRSAAPMAMLAETAPIALAERPIVARVDAADAIERSIEAEGAYKLTSTSDQDGRYVSLLLRDEGDWACGVMTPDQARILIEDVARVLAKVEVPR